MKCRLLSLAARTDRGVLLTFIREKTFSGSSKPHRVWGDIDLTQAYGHFRGQGYPSGAKAADHPISCPGPEVSFEETAIDLPKLVSR